MLLGLLGFFLALVLMVVLIGSLLVALFHGFTSGDWTWLAVPAVTAVLFGVFDKLGLLSTIND